MGPRSDGFHSPRRATSRAILLVIALATLVAACIDVDSSDDSSTTTTAGTDSTTTTTPEVTSTTAESGPTIIEVVVSGGSVEGGVQRAEIALGTEVTLRVTSDIADEVHVHGYDHTKDVEAGGTVEITFVADLAGVWEAELEESKIQLVELQVS